MSHDFNTAAGLVPFPNCTFQVNQTTPDMRPPRLPPTMLPHPNNPLPGCGTPIIYPPAWNNPLSMATPGNLMNPTDSIAGHPLPGGDFLNPTQAILANRIHALLSMADPNLDNRGAEIIENWRQFQQAAIANNLDPNMLALCHSANFDPAGNQRRKNATRETTSTLKAWLKEHRKNPYPTKGEKIMLAILTKMTLTQVSTWFANARRRLKKENKMTWAPRNRTDDDNSEDDAGDEIGIDIEDISDAEDEGSKNPVDFKNINLEYHNETNKQKEFSSNASGTEESEEPPAKKSAKIWSIVDTLAKDDKVRVSENQSLNISFNKSPLSSNSCPLTPSENSSASSVFKSPGFFFPGNYPKPGYIPNLSFLQGLPISNAPTPGQFLGGSQSPFYSFQAGFNQFAIPPVSLGLFPNISTGSDSFQCPESKRHLHKSNISTDVDSQSQTKSSAAC